MAIIRLTRSDLLEGGFTTKDVQDFVNLKNCAYLCKESQGGTGR